MRLAVVGSRMFDDYARMERVLDSVHGVIDTIVSGGAKGADTLAARYAHEHGIELKIFLPDWTQGRGAGFARNQLIVDASDAMVAFTIDDSRGTANSIRLARDKGIPVHIVRIKS